MKNTIYIESGNVSDIRNAIEKCRNTHEQYTIFISKGVCCFDIPLILDDNNSNLTIKGEDGTVFTAAQKLNNLKWIPYKNGIWSAKADIKSFSRMFADGREQILCRYPNYDNNNTILNGTAKPSEIKMRAAKYQNPKCGIVRAIHSFGWGGNSYIITGKDRSSPCGLALSWFGDNNAAANTGQDCC